MDREIVNKKLLRGRRHGIYQGFVLLDGGLKEQDLVTITSKCYMLCGYTCAKEYNRGTSGEHDMHMTNREKC